MTLHTALFLLQSATTPDNVRDFGVYIADIAAAGAAGFAWRTNAQLARIEAILTERKSGVVDTVAEHGDTLATHAGTLERHGVRLDGHDQALVRVNDELIEDRRHNRGRREADRE